MWGLLEPQAAWEVFGGRNLYADPSLLATFYQLLGAAHTRRTVQRLTRRGTATLNGLVTSKRAASCSELPQMGRPASSNRFAAGSSRSETRLKMRAPPPGRPGRSAGAVRPPRAEA